MIQPSRRSAISCSRRHRSPRPPPRDRATLGQPARHRHAGRQRRSKRSRSPEARSASSPSPAGSPGRHSGPNRSIGEPRSSSTHHAVQKGQAAGRPLPQRDQDRRWEPAVDAHLPDAPRDARAPCARSRACRASSGCAQSTRAVRSRISSVVACCCPRTTTFLRGESARPHRPARRQPERRWPRARSIATDEASSAPRCASAWRRAPCGSGRGAGSAHRRVPPGAAPDGPRARAHRVTSTGSLPPRAALPIGPALPA